MKIQTIVNLDDQDEPVSTRNYLKAAFNLFIDGISKKELN